MSCYLTESVPSETFSDSPVIFHGGNLLAEQTFSNDEAGLYYYGYRLYSPVLGRFLGRDPIGIDGGVNIYSYLANRIITHVDYLGLLQYHVKDQEYLVDDTMVPKHGVGITYAVYNKSWDLATQDLLFQVNVICTCSITGNKKEWRFFEFKVDHKITMYGVSKERWIEGGNNPEGYAKAKENIEISEKQHQKDLNEWSMNATKPLVQFVENLIKERVTRTFSTLDECVSSFEGIRKSVIEGMKTSLYEGMRLSKKKYDEGNPPLHSPLNKDGANRQ